MTFDRNLSHGFSPNFLKSKMGKIKKNPKFSLTPLVQSHNRNKAHRSHLNSIKKELFTLINT